MAFLPICKTRLNSVVFGSLVAGAILIGGCSDEPSPAAVPGDVLSFTVAELEGALRPLEGIIDDPEVAIETDVNLQDVDPTRGINTQCPEVFHDSTISVEQAANWPSDFRVETARTVYLFPDVAAAADLLTAVNATPIGCDNHPLNIIEEPVSSVERSRFEGHDAVTVRTVQTIDQDDELRWDHVNYWVRRDNVVVRLRIVDDLTDAAPLLSDVLTSIDTLAG